MKESLRGISSDLEHSFFIDHQNNIRLDESELMLKWGFDALYSNIGYRLVDANTKDERIRSIPLGKKGALIDKVPINIPYGYSKQQNEKIDCFRSKIVIGDTIYLLDIARSDLLGKLANEAVLPAISDISLLSIVVALILFTIVNIIAMRLIVRPVKKLTNQVSKIQPHDLTKRIDLTDVPNEFLPIVTSLNEALDRVEKGFMVQKRFVADAAHELRTPLTILSSRIQLTLEKSQKQKRLLIDLDYMSRIVEQLLELSRVQGNAEREISKVDVVHTARSVLSMLAPLALEKEQNMELAVLTPNEVLFDEGELSIVIKNLVENAIKHSPRKSSILVTINTDSLTVEDSGLGIPDGAENMIFSRFWRANQSNMSGSGLGLAITKEILSNHSATVRVSKSESLGGAKFELSFS